MKYYFIFPDNGVLPKCHKLAPKGTPEGDRCLRIGVPVKGYTGRTLELIFCLNIYFILSFI